jgi:type III polyketide synthase
MRSELQLKDFLAENEHSLQKLIQVNRATGIDTRAVIQPLDGPFFNQPTPTICDADDIFRTAGVDLAVEACKKAISEWGGSINDITHTVAVTVTNAGAPGFDFLVAQKLHLPGTVERTLLAGVGCAGGLSAVRAAQGIANAASARGRVARILVVALELSSTQARCSFDYSSKHPQNWDISPALFADGASALMVCNEFAAEAKAGAIYSLVDCTTAVIPHTAQEMSLCAEPLGTLRTVLPITS